MSDLINKKLIYADDIFRYIKAEINPYGKPFEGSAYELGLKVMRYIENMSTDLDLDKVIEQLEDKAIEELGITKSQFDMDRGEYSSYFSLSLGDVVEIIKKGGIE